MDCHFFEKTCLCDAVKLSGLTSRRFGELFKSNFDMTPNRYIVTRKVERAKELLHTEGLSLCEVSAICGFSDVYYFSKTFKNETGVSPSRWKSRLI